MKYFLREDFSYIKVVPANRARKHDTPCPKGLSLYEGSQLLASNLYWEDLPDILRDRLPIEWAILSREEVIRILTRILSHVGRCRFKNRDNNEAHYILVLSD